jgi:hypothetical protein
MTTQCSWCGAELQLDRPSRGEYQVRRCRSCCGANAIELVGERLRTTKHTNVRESTGKVKLPR